jgi:hypothetical protein
MKYETLNEVRIAILEPGENMNTLNDVLDMNATASYEGCIGMIVPMNCMNADFFRLKTGLAGEFLQKFTNYKMKIAVAGDFSGFSSQSLRDFIYESNKGRQVFFKASIDDCVKAIVRAAG